jgi:hypothetical protein
MALVGAALPAILGAIAWSPKPKDHAYRVWNPTSRDWLKLAYACWKDFRKASLEELDSGALLMVATDITGFYEHISHELLTSDLKKAGVDDSIVALLIRCLARWAVINGRGLPQSHSASHLLAKLYFNVIDRSLHDAHFRHCRYVDDTRIFCRDTAEAKKALLTLTHGVRRRGLSLQSAKTKLLPAGKARDLVEGVIPTLSPLAKIYLKEIAQLLGVDAAYLSVTEAEEALAQSDFAPPTEMLQHAYRLYFIDAADFEKTLFHYILSRLGAAKDSFALDHVLTLLEVHPEETEAILKYVAAAAPPTQVEARIISYLTSPEAVYAYQHYQVFRWRAQFLAPPTEPFMAHVRRVFSAPQSPSYLRSASRLLLALHGSDADLEDLAAAYGAVSDETDRAEALIALFRMEKGRRNAALGQARSDGMLPGAAIALVKDGKLPSALGAA